MDPLTDEQLSAMSAEELQALQWQIDEQIQLLLAYKHRVHDARERATPAPVTSGKPHVIGFGAGPLPQIEAAKGE